MSILAQRARQLNQRTFHKGSILYWMSRDQRADNNWAILAAQELAQKHQTYFSVIFIIYSQLGAANKYHYQFMLHGLQETANILAKKNIPFYNYIGHPLTQISAHIEKHKVGAVVTDFSPLRHARQNRKKLAAKISIPLWEVDAHNVVPVWRASDKQEYAAWTIRPKINQKLGQYLTNLPTLKQVKKPEVDGIKRFNSAQIINQLNIPTYRSQKINFEPGTKAANHTLKNFVNNRLVHYSVNRNIPYKENLSNLSPYLHFGQISAQRIARHIKEAKASQADKDSFLEELIIRRELADNFCYYNQDYKSVDGFPNWAQQTLAEHASDKRHYQYNLDQLEQATTHDEVWNAAQNEMVFTGKMHGYLRMYWAKKILEWTESPAQALQFAIILNDRYSLDGRDPNGYTGIAWSIGGVHDRPWPERKVFGKVRYMSSSGLERKFNPQQYVKQINELTKKL